MENSNLKIMNVVDINFESGSATQVITTQNSDHNHMTIEFTPGNSNDISNIFMQGIDPTPDLIIIFVDTCIPENPAYIRWVNRLGGWEYKMFELRNSRTLEVSGISTFEPFSNNNYENDRPVREYNKQATNKMTVGVFNETTEEIKRCAGITLSPRVEFWNTELQKWQGLTNINSSVTWEENIARDSISLEFYITKVNLQF